MYAASDISIMLVTSADTPATMNTMQSILQHTSSHKCLWVQVNAAANMASSTVPLLYYPSVTQNNARRGGQASKINNSARAILHSVLDGKTWRGSMDVYPNVQSMVIGSAGQINNEVVTDQLLEKVLLFLWLP
ncbi:hypothetical protein EON65_34815 [archaeon]|nr:MAG: hypothetical protein EON65_34815 [archaeon]